MTDEKNPMAGLNPKGMYRVPVEAVHAMKEGRMIEAIKIIRESGNLGLADARRILAEMQRTMPQAGAVHRAERARGLSPGEMPRSEARGMGFIFVAIVAIAAFALLFWP